MADAQKGNTQLERDISVSLDKIGDVKRSQNDNAGALAAYDESLAIARHLAAADPGNVQWQTDLVVSLYKVAILADGEKKSRGGRRGSEDRRATRRRGQAVV